MAFVNGVNAKAIPKLAMVSELTLGDQAVLHIDDPETRVASPTPEQLQANLLALEYSFFGDLRTANRIWRDFDLPVFDGVDDGALPSPELLTFTDEAIAHLRPRRCRVQAEGLFEERAMKQSGYAFTKLTVQAPAEMYAGRESGNWRMLMRRRIAAEEYVKSTSESLVRRLVLDTPSDVPRREIRESSVTSSGIIAEANTVVWLQE